MAKNIIEISKEEYEEKILKQKGIVVLDFYSDECPPCEALAPKYEDMALKYGHLIKFYKIFRQQNRELATQLGVNSSPTVIFYQDGKEVGHRLTGGIKKSELKAEIQNLLPSEVFAEIEKNQEKKTRTTDVVIIGGGPAGMTAAIYAAQAKLKTILVDSSLPGGQVKSTHLVSNYPGTGNVVQGWELAHKMETQTKESGAEIIGAVDITEINIANGNGKHSVLVDGELEIQSDVMILAMGAKPRLINIPGEIEYAGKGISYCATCDGKYYDGKEVVVIGGGNSAVEESIFLTRFATKVTIIHQFDKLTANATAIEKALANPKINVIYSSEPRKFEIIESNKMKITLEDMKTHKSSTLISDGIFIFIGMVPNTSLLNGKIQKDKWGYLVTNEDMETNIPGVYAVGDIRVKKVRQAATAVGDGCIAAVMSEKYLESEK
ncbi:MAG: FAD-dependent oxidoreductase [Leptospiraceae bacterium]|nr:FAD-dependent oxidoreductase [Leptospiraceae bacterium]MCP5495704.1 FAD-dependent oxidoreductase [Leptospiraceae bacterium]